MKTLFLLISLLAPNIFFAQERGVTPATNSSGATARGATARVAPTTRAVVIGISDYQQDAIPDLNYADRDAEAFAAWLQSPAAGSLPDSSIKLLLNSEATSGKMVAAFDWLISASAAGDAAVIYFSGHGDVERVTKFQRGYWLSWDAPPMVYAAGAFPLTFLQDIITTLSETGVQVIVVSDACRAGKLAGSAIGGTQAATAVLAKQFANEIKLLSCQPNEFSLESTQWGGGHGCFTYHLINGLYGLADRNHDAVVNLMELENYLDERVPAETAPHPQFPFALGNKTARLAVVDATLLARIKESIGESAPPLEPIEPRRAEAQFLAAADSAIQELYAAFNAALARGDLLPTDSTRGTSANGYYHRLMQEPSMAGLQGLITRNFAAALQDDAQQAVNAILQINLSVVSKSTLLRIRQYEGLPRLLARAAELLGPQHYAYATLKARERLFEGMTLYFETIAAQDAESGARVIEKYRQSLQYESDSPLAHYYMSLCFAIKMNEPDSALVHAREAMHYAQTWVLPYAHLAYSFCRRYERYEEAEALLHEAMRMDSNSVVVWTSVGALHYYQDQYPEAIAAYRQVLRLDSTDALAWSNIGVAYLETGYYDQAETALLTALRINARLFSGYYVLGCLYLRTGRIEKAEGALLRAQQINPMSLPTRDSLAQLYIAGDRYAEAEAQLLEIRRLNPDANWVLPDLAGLLAADNREARAIEYLEQYLENGGQDFDTLVQNPRLGALLASEAGKALLKKYFPEQFKD